VEHCNVGSGEAVDSVHVGAEVGSMCIVILQGKLQSRARCTTWVPDFVVDKLQVTLLCSVTKRNA